MRWLTISAISSELFGHTQADQGLVADQREGEADQDWRQGDPTWTRCRVQEKVGAGLAK